MLKFDIHCHVHKKKTFLRDDGSFFLTPEEHLEMFKKKGIGMGLILPTVHYESVTTVQTVEEAAEIAKAYPDRFMFFMNLDPRLYLRDPKADFSRLIEYYLEMGAKGVGEICCNIPVDDPLMDNMLFYINKYELPLTFHLTYKEFCDYGMRTDVNMNSLESAINKYPKIKFLGHSQAFWAEISGDDQHDGYPTGRVVPGGRVVELMRKYHNLYGDLSAGSGLNAIRRDPEFGVSFLNEFADRLFFGQDFCSPKNFDSLVLSEYLDELLLNMQLSREVYNKICFENAAKLLGFTPEETGLTG